MLHIHVHIHIFIIYFDQPHIKTHRGCCSRRRRRGASRTRPRTWRCHFMCVRIYMCVWMSCHVNLLLCVLWFWWGGVELGSCCRSLLNRPDGQTRASHGWVHQYIHVWRYYTHIIYIHMLIHPYNTYIHEWEYHIYV